MSAEEIVDAVVIGAGVVGLAVARALAISGHETLLLERHRIIGHEASSRNSCVIHAGLYYPAGSLKARLCVRGKALLYAYCDARGIAHRRCGKLVVSGPGRLDELHALRGRAIANGVHDTEILDAAQVRALEPAVRCAAGLLSPSTGILDVHELMTTLLGDLEDHDGVLVLDATVDAVQPKASGIELSVSSGGQSSTLTARRVVNCAGLEAVALARRIEDYPAACLPRAFLAKGSYFRCSGRPFQRLVYPLPEQAGLGIHATLDLNGNVRFGPDVEWVEAVDYNVEPARAEPFYAAIRAYWPALEDGSLQPDYAGIRAKISGPGEAAADFMFQGPADHGIPGLVNLFGIESPGLTAALAIGAHVAAMLA